jgi:hypothetical protein
VVRRVSKRVGQGLTVKLALAIENRATINEETWKKALKAHPEFYPLYEAGKGKFLERATERLARSEELYNLRWLLERRHSDLFGRPEPGTTVNVSQTVAVGIPEDVLKRARELVRDELAKPNPAAAEPGKPDAK